MKKFLLLAGWALLAAVVVRAQNLTLPTASPRAGVVQTIGITKVSVDYGRPAVNGREIWGKLVPFGTSDTGFGTTRESPWRAGSDMSTVVTFSTDVRVAGKPLAAGSYSLHLVLTPEGVVTAIFNRNTAQWGSFFYDPAEDALRVATKWEEAPHQEQLAYEFNEVTKNGATLALRWEKKRIPLALAVDTDAIVVASLKRELTGAHGFNDRSYFNASDYLTQNNLDPALALIWAERSLDIRTNGRVTFENLSQKAVVLEKLGRAAEAATVMDQALPLGTVGEVHQYGRRLIAAKQAERALAVFKQNAERFPNVWPVNYGLARGYSAVGNYPAALEALLKAQTQVPAGDTVNAAAIVTNIEKLKRGENIN
jgi:tetratricopeptide (TPR) repeat protein